MNVVKLGLVLGTLLLSARVGQAQENQDEMKNSLLKKVEDRLRAEEERILKEISKIIDEELSGWKGGEKKTVVKPKKEKPAPKKSKPGSKEPGYLGVFPAELEAEEMQSLGLQSGIILREIVAGSPAEKAGLKEGDVVSSLNGTPIEDMDSFRDVILDLGAGSKMIVGYHRNGIKNYTTVTLGNRHAMEATPTPAPKKKEEFKRDRTEEELRKMTKKFLEEKQEERESRPQERVPGELPGLDFLALDEEAFESIRGMLEQFGMDPEQFFAQGEDGKWRPNGELMEMFKGFDLRKMFEQFRENMPEIPGLEMPEKDDSEMPREAPVEKRLPLKKKEKAPVKKPGWIGIVPVELSEEDALELNIDKGRGMVVTEVIEGSPAHLAKLQEGDVITHINGKPLLGEDGLIEFVRSSHAGQKATFTIRRDGKKKKIRIILGERKN